MVIWEQGQYQAVCQTKQLIEGTYQNHPTQDDGYNVVRCVSLLSFTRPQTIALKKRHNVWNRWQGNFCCLDRKTDNKLVRVGSHSTGVCCQSSTLNLFCVNVFIRSTELNDTMFAESIINPINETSVSHLERISQKNSENHSNCMQET